MKQESRAFDRVLEYKKVLVGKAEPWKPPRLSKRDYARVDSGEFKHYAWMDDCTVLNAKATVRPKLSIDDAEQL